MSEKNLHGYVVRYNRETDEWEACRVDVTYVDLRGQGKFIACESEVVDFTVPAKQYNQFQKQLADRILERIRYNINHTIDNVAREIAGKISYTKKCVCQHPPTHLANDCHEHTENPDHYFGGLEAECEYESCYANDSESDPPYIR